MSDPERSKLKGVKIMADQDEVNPQISESFDVGVSREEAEDWLNGIPLFEEEKEGEGSR